MRTVERLLAVHPHVTPATMIVGHVGHVEVEYDEVRSEGKQAVSQ